MILCTASTHDPPPNHPLDVLRELKHCVFQCDACNTVLDIWHMLEQQCYLCINCTCRVVKVRWSDGEFACRLRFTKTGELSVITDKPKYGWS